MKVTDREKSAIAFHARCCARNGRTEAEMLRQVRQNYGWCHEKAGIAAAAFRSEENQ